MLRTMVLGLTTLVGLLDGCGAETQDAGVTKPTGEPRPVVFEPGELVWAERSTIHVGDQMYDLGPRIVTAMDWTPYGLYLELTDAPADGPFEDVFFDGETMTAEPDVYSDVITSPDGELAAWIDRSGPERRAGAGRAGGGRGHRDR